MNIHTYTYSNAWFPYKSEGIYMFFFLLTYVAVFCGLYLVVLQKPIINFFLHFLRFYRFSSSSPN
jgi:hypothetical protein